jgi:hypothetical protein
MLLPPTLLVVYIRNRIAMLGAKTAIGEKAPSSSSVSSLLRAYQAALNQLGHCSLASHAAGLNRSHKSIHQVAHNAHANWPCWIGVDFNCCPLIIRRPTFIWDDAAGETYWDEDSRRDLVGFHLLPSL